MQWWRQPGDRLFWKTLRSRRYFMANRGKDDNAAMRGAGGEKEVGRNRHHQLLLGPFSRPAHSSGPARRNQLPWPEASSASMLELPPKQLR